MTKKKHEVLDAALNVFIRYGFRRVTMGDLASEAGMSRPALYLLYPNKEAIFRAVLIDFVARAKEEVNAGMEGHATVQGKLGFVFDVWVVHPFELVRTAPDARELTDCTHDFASDVVEDSHRTLEIILVNILEPSADALALHGLTPGDVARVLVASARGFKDYSRDSDELHALIAGLIGMTVALLGT